MQYSCQHAPSPVDMRGLHGRYVRAIFSIPGLHFRATDLIFHLVTGAMVHRDKTERVNMNIEFSGTYTGPNGAIVDYARVPESSWKTAFNRQMKHVFNSEAAAQATDENDRRAKAGEAALTPDERRELIAEAVADYIEQIYTGTWGVKDKAYSPRGQANRLAVLFNAAAEKATRKKLDSDGTPKNEAGEYINRKDGMGYAIELWVANFLKNATVPEGETRTLGEIRTAEAEAEASDQLAKELAAKAAKKAAAAREAQTPVLEI